MNNLHKIQDMDAVLKPTSLFFSFLLFLAYPPLLLGTYKTMPLGEGNFYASYIRKRTQLEVPPSHMLSKLQELLLKTREYMDNRQETQNLESVLSDNIFSSFLSFFHACPPLLLKTYKKIPFGEGNLYAPHIESDTNGGPPLTFVQQLARIAQGQSS